MTTTRDEAEAFRNSLVDSLRSEGFLRSKRALNAMRVIPRHRFVPGISLPDAYENRGIPITDEAGKMVSSLSSPTWVAVMLEELALAPGMRVLEVGAGTGYHAALLSHIVGSEGRVVTVEIEPWLAYRARERLNELGLSQATVVTGDGAVGVPTGDPFDRILLTTGTWEVFPAWIEQLVQGGRLVAPLQFGGTDESACIVVNLVRHGGCLVGKVVMGAGMVPMRGEVGGARTEESSRAGASWRPTSTSDLVCVRVFPRQAPIEPASNQKLFVRGVCQILLERAG